MNILVSIGIVVLAVLALILPRHDHQWLQGNAGASAGIAYSYSVVECGNNDLCLGA